MKLNLGAGRDIRDGFANVDIVALSGIDLVCDLNVSLPLRSDSVEEIVAINVLEHLPNTLGIMEELWRVGRSGCRVCLRVPYWNGYHAFRDPTHRAWFHHESFNYYDPTKFEGKKVSYYTRARFRQLGMDFWVGVPFWRKERYLLAKNPLLKGMLRFLARYFCNIILFLQVELEVLK